MVPFASWVKGLIARCAKTDETNSFTEVNTFQKSPVIQGTIDMSQGPQNGNNGTVSAVTFTDADNATVGSVCATYSNTEAKGIYLKVSQGKLGIEKTDENRYVTYAPNPDEAGGDNQIATYGYVSDQIDALTETVNQLAETLNGLLPGFNTTLLGKIDELKTYVDTQDTAVRALITDLTTRLNLLENVEGDDESALMEAFNNRLVTAVSSGFLWDIDNIGCLRLVLIAEAAVDGAVHSIKTGTTIDPNDYYVYQAGTYFQFNNDDKQYVFPNGGTEDTGDYSKYASSRITVGKWKVLSPYYSEEDEISHMSYSRLCLIVRVA